VGVGRALCGSPSPTPCPSRVTQSRLHSTAARRGWNISREGDFHCALHSSHWPQTLPAPRPPPPGSGAAAGAAPSPWPWGARAPHVPQGTVRPLAKRSVGASPAPLTQPRSLGARGRSRGPRGSPWPGALAKHPWVMDEGGCLSRAGACPAPRMRLHNPVLALRAGPGCDCLGWS